MRGSQSPERLAEGRQKGEDGSERKETHTGLGSGVLPVESAQPTNVLWEPKLQVRLKVTEYRPCLGTTLRTAREQHLIKRMRSFSSAQP